ncbi:FAD-dependent oxidoreductase [Aerosakkonema sp. BLCC-F183]|uniref:FAD-dependent oxidoreductase n=1 Tax=Aerosakkonema sp. BLCC-F183 TaxID=3342834 RepID=UPI0035B8FA9E
MKRSFITLPLSLILLESAFPVALAAPPRQPDKTVECEILVIGGGLAGAAAAYEGLLAGKTVCLTEITDWVGGQVSSQGVSALDERTTQRQRQFFSRGYLELRERIKRKYGKLNPGECWVSVACFIPSDGHKFVFSMLENAEKRGRGKLKWFPSTVVKELGITPPNPPVYGGGQEGNGKLIESAIAIQHNPAKNTPPLNTEPLSQTIEDAYRYENSSRFDKTIIRFLPLKRTKKSQTTQPTNWYVLDATETGEIIALADVPYRLGIDPRSYLEPSGANDTGDPYCTQGYTYTFAMEATKEPQTHQMPPFYSRYSPYYSFEAKRFNFASIFTYRRIWSNPNAPKELKIRSRETFGVTPPKPGDISMQNWTWGNDYRPGTSQDNLIYTREQLQTLGQLQPSGWMGGLRVESLRGGEELSQGYFYWLVAGTTDSQLGDGVKQPHPNNRYLTGLNSPMGTVHGLSKYPYIREGRRIIGRPAWGHPEGFTLWEVDISRKNFREDYYRNNLSTEQYRRLWALLSGLNATAVIREALSPEQVKERSRSAIYPDSVGIGHYTIDFHPCLAKSPPETPGNQGYPNEAMAASQSYPFQIPLRAMIPQKIDNMLIAGKSIATSHSAAAAYRVHSFEWSVGAAAGTTAAFALENNLMPYQLVEQLPRQQPQLEALQRRLQQNGNPTAFPDTSIFNEFGKNWQ